MLIKTSLLKGYSSLTSLQERNPALEHPRQNSAPPSLIMSYTYTAYGITLRSDLLLPELIQTRTPVPDVVIRFGEIPWMPDASDYCVTKVTLQEVYFCWPNTGKFLARQGSEIVVEPLLGTKEYVLRLFLLGAVLAAVLHQRGLLLLHASAIKLGSGAIAFIGAKGAGKSTMAVHMQGRQHSLVADDVVAIDIGHSGSIRVLPGSPQYKLWPDTISSLGVTRDDLPLLHPKLEKRGYRTDGEHSLAPLELEAIYSLCHGDRLQVHALSSVESFIELVRHSFLARHLRSTGAVPLHFDQCSMVARKVPVFRLERPHSLTLLAAAAALLEEHTTSLFCERPDWSAGPTSKAAAVN